MGHHPSFGNLGGVGFMVTSRLPLYVAFLRLLVSKGDRKPPYNIHIILVIGEYPNPGSNKNQRKLWIGLYRNPSCARFSPPSSPLCRACLETCHKQGGMKGGCDTSHHFCDSNFHNFIDWLFMFMTSHFLGFVWFSSASHHFPVSNFYSSTASTSLWMSTELYNFCDGKYHAYSNVNGIWIA